MEERTAVEPFRLRVMPMLTKTMLKMRAIREVIWEERHVEESGR